MYKAEDFLCSTKEAGLEPIQEHSVALNMLTFMILWKLKRYKESAPHLEHAASLVNSFIRGNRHSKFSRLSLLNIYGLVVLGLAGLTVQVENDWDKAIGICADGMNLLKNEDVVGKSLILEMIDFLRQRRANLGEFLVNHEYNNVFYLSVFIPFISHHAPVIKKAELERKRESEPYQRIKQSLDNKRTASSIAHRHFKASPKREASLPRGKGICRPWWEKKKLVGNVFSWRKELYSLERNTETAASALKCKLKPIKMEQNNKHIMLEFTTDENDEQINLVPIDVKQKKVTALDLFD